MLGDAIPKNNTIIHMAIGANLSVGITPDIGVYSITGCGVN